ncbi:MAG: Ycf66 family protein [Cyanobacteria bacterium P01_D01_bin.73]
MRAAEDVMLAKILAILVALGSVGWYGLAWTLPTLSRRYDVVWAGMGLFYGLVLWVCAGQVVGAIALGQLAILGLVTALGYQVLQLRDGVAEESAALPQGAGVMALAGAVRSRVTGLKAAPPQLKLTGDASKGVEVEEKGAIATPAAKAATTETDSEAKPSEAKAVEAKTKETKTVETKAAKSKGTGQAIATGKGVYQRKNVRKFDHSKAKSTGQPVYQRKKVRRFDAEEGKPEKEAAIVKPKSTKGAGGTDERKAAAEEEVISPVKAEVKPDVAKTPEVEAAKSVTIALGIDININGDFWEMAAIAPDAVLIAEDLGAGDGVIATVPVLEDPWTTPPMDPAELTLGTAQKMAEEMAKEIADEARKSTQPETEEPTSDPASKLKPKPARPRPSTSQQDSNWPDDADSNWPNDDADSNWPDDDADSNWPDDNAQRTKPKPRRPRKRPKPSVPVVEGEVVSRSPRRPVILDAELIRDDED